MIHRFHALVAARLPWVKAAKDAAVPTGRSGTGAGGTLAGRTGGDPVPSREAEGRGRARPYSTTQSGRGFARPKSSTAGGRGRARPARDDRGSARSESPNRANQPPADHDLDLLGSV